MDTSAEKTYLSYQTMVSQTNESMAALSSVCSSLRMDSYAQSLEDIRERMRNKVFSVGIMGEFRRGKSTVINALLGKEIVPSDIVPTSATINYIRWGSKPDVSVHFKDGTEQPVGIDELSNFVTKLTPEAEQMSETVDHAVVYYPCRFCQNGVQIIDTPGLNDDERMTAITENVIPSMDAIILVMVPESPFSMSEAEFVRTKLMTSDLGRVIFVMNKIDNVRKADRQRLLDHTKSKIQDTVLSRISSIYGEESDEYKEAVSKLGTTRIFGVSARDALEGRLEGDEAMVEKSGFPEFEAALSYMLTEERGMLDLLTPVNAVLSIGREATKNIAMRRSAAQLAKDKVERITTEGKETIAKEREAKKETLTKLKNRANAVYGKLLPELDTAYSQAEAELIDRVNSLEIDPQSVSSVQRMNQTAQVLEQNLRKALEQALSDQTERLKLLVNQEIERDLEEVFDLAKKIEFHLDSIKDKIAPKTNNTFDWGVAALDAVTNVMAVFGGGVFGIGGIIAGWKQAGWKGGVIGGAAGYAAGLGVVEIALALGGGALAWPIAIPVLALGGIAATFVGKGAVKLALSKQIGAKNAAAIRASLLTAVKESMVAVRAQRTLEHWLKEATNKAYNSVADKIDCELEQSLVDFESALAQLNLDQQKSESELQATDELLDRCETSLKKVEATIRPIKAKLSESLAPPEMAETETAAPEAAFV